MRFLDVGWEDGSVEQDVMVDEQEEVVAV